MAKTPGRAMLLKIGDGEVVEVFVNFGGMTAKTLKLNNERIDATTPHPTTPEGTYWRETLDGVKSVSASGDVLLVDDAQEARLMAVAMSPAAAANFQVIIPNIGTFAGEFSVEVEFSGDDNLTASLSLESNGAITFAAS